MHFLLYASEGQSGHLDRKYIKYFKKNALLRAIKILQLHFFSNSNSESIVFFYQNPYPLLGTRLF